MTLGTVGSTLRRITDFLRKITAPVQPWEWDELPVRHWWGGVRQVSGTNEHE